MLRIDECLLLSYASRIDGGQVCYLELCRPRGLKFESDAGKRGGGFRGEPPRNHLWKRQGLRIKGEISAVVNYFYLLRIKQFKRNDPGFAVHRLLKSSRFE